MEGKLERILLRLERLECGACPCRGRSLKQQLFASFAGGLARGFGMAVGFTLLGTLAVVLLRRLATLSTPLLGGYLAEVIRAVLERL